MNFDIKTDGELPDEDWNFIPVQTKGYSEAQLNLWLNYEFARSSRTMVEDVKVLRQQTGHASAGSEAMPQKKTARFALFLARRFPNDFPSVPFHRLNPEISKRILKEAHLEEDCFDSKIIRQYDMYEVAQMMHHGDLAFSTSPHDQRFNLMEIDYGWSDRRINLAFKHWLKQRRQELMQAYPEPKTSSSKPAPNPASFFTPDPSREKRGQRHNRREFAEYLKKLAALRVYRHFMKHVINAYEHTKVGGRNILYGDEARAWQRAAEEATQLFQRLNKSWEFSFYPPFVLDPDVFNHSFLVGHSDPLGTEKMSPGKKALFRQNMDEFLKQEFVGATERANIYCGK